MFLVSSCSCLCPIHWSQVLCWEWRCIWSSADRRSAMLQLHLNDQQFYCLGCGLYQRLYGRSISPISCKITSLTLEQSPYQSKNYIITKTKQSTIQCACFMAYTVHTHAVCLLSPEVFSNGIQASFTRSNHLSYSLCNSRVKSMRLLRPYLL